MLYNQVKTLLLILIFLSQPSFASAKQKSSNRLFKAHEITFNQYRSKGKELSIIGEWIMMKTMESPAYTVDIIIEIYGLLKSKALTRLIKSNDMPRSKAITSEAPLC